VNGIRARHAQVQEWIAQERPDVVCLQEIKATQQQIPALFGFEGYWCYWHGGKGYSGVALHVSQAFSAERPTFIHPEFDYENRIVAVELGAITVASIYVPNGGKDFPAKMRFLESMDAYAASFARDGRALAMLGDMNVARTDRDVHPKERKPRAIGQLPEERAIIERILGRGLVDVGRALDPDNDGLFTWWAPWRNMRQRNIGWRLDYVMASASLTATSCVVRADVGTSDHAPVVATFDR
jgi:exodeoxyribonuclease-3